MAEPDRGNPFGDLDNPFQDPAVTEHRPSSQYATLDVYNPFDNRGMPPPYHETPPVLPAATMPAAPANIPPAPAAKKTSPTEPKNYGSYGTQESTAAATADLLRRQEELNRKAEELDRRERELQNAALGTSALRQNNWPPLPSFCPVKPCFYQDITVEIPQDFQKTVSIMYYLWMCSTGTLLLNFLACLAWFCVDSGEGSGFGLAILWALLFTPCSFVCWYRPLYKAFRSDSSFNFFVFFFIYFVQDVLYVLQAIGIPGWGFSGWISALTVLKNGSVGVSVLMMIVSILLTTNAVLGIVMLKRIHSIYRRTGASFQKAQEEFAAGVFSNQAVRTAATNVAAGAAQNAFKPLAVSGLIGCVSWKRPYTLVITLFTLLTALCVMLSLAGSILSCQNAQLVKYFDACQKEKNWCVCCHLLSEEQIPSSCSKDVEILTMYPNPDCRSIRNALKDLLFSVCGLTILSTIICTLSAVICCIQVFSLDVIHVLAPQRSTSLNQECLSQQDTILQSMIECEEFVPPVPPPPYYPPEYTCSSETDAQSITYNGSMDSPIPLYPTDFPPSYESVMGMREDSQATLFDAHVNEVSCLSVSDRIDSTGHSGNEDSSPSEDSVLLEMQGSIRSVDYVLYRSIQRSRADYCLSVDCGQCGHHRQSPTLSLQGPFEETPAPRVKGGRSFSCSTPSACDDPLPHVGGAVTRSCNRLETIGRSAGPCLPEVRLKGKVPAGAGRSRGSGCCLHHSSPCQTPDCPHRRYSENTRPAALCTSVPQRIVIRSHSDPGICSSHNTDLRDADCTKALEDDVSISSIDTAICSEACLYRHYPRDPTPLLRTSSAGKGRFQATRKAVQRLSNSGALSLGDLKGGRSTRVLVARFLHRSRRSLKEGTENGNHCHKQILKSPLPPDQDRHPDRMFLQSCGDLSPSSSLRRLLSTGRRGHRRPQSLNGGCKESAV
ncbi:protein ENTREP3-like [Rhinophrynus dorsalis]